MGRGDDCPATRRSALTYQHIRAIRCALLLAVTTGCGAALAQALPDTIWVPVIYYDYKADGTNPNFEPSGYSEASGGLKPGMVQRTLSVNRKPVFQANLCYNDRVSSWFQPSGGASSAFQYNATAGRWEWTNLNNYLARPNEWVGSSFNATDPMANIVIYGTLPFYLSDRTTGTYQYAGTGVENGNPVFFPLDGRGFGTQPASYPAYNWTNTQNHNFSFAMELHHEFVYRPGLTFRFAGDDDVWAYINDTLRMDLGGIHGADSGTINLDGLGLVEGQRYNFDFFYCERHVTTSDILITTNLVAPVTVESLHVAAVPIRPVITAGQSVQYTVTVYVDSAGVVFERPAYADLVSWSVTGTAANPPMSQDSGGTSTFYGRRAYTDYVVTATIRDPVTGRNITKTMTVHVDPGPADHLVIERDDTPDNWTPDPLDVMMLPVGVDRDTAWAVARDLYGNLVSGWLTQPVTWRAFVTQVATVAGTGGKPAEGVVTRGTFAASSDSTLIVASMPGNVIPDTLRVLLLNSLTCAVPVANPRGTVFTGTLTVTLTSATDGAAIWYCFGCDVLTPGGAGAILYAGPITLNQNDTTTLKAIAVKSGYDNSPLMVERYINDRDTQGPHITRALFFLGNPPGSSGNRPDTLIVTFNELVRPGDLQSLTAAINYIDSLTGGREFTVFAGLSPNSTGDSLVTSITIIMPNGAAAVTPGEDQVQLKPDVVHDRWGNPAPTDGPKVTIQWGREYELIIQVSSNPFRPGSSAIPATVNLTPQSRARNGEPPTHATVLKVSAIRPLEDTRSSMKVYDAVGNLVRDVPSYAGVDSGGGAANNCYFFWDGRNRNDRLVGAGTYLAVLQVSEAGKGSPQVTKQKIGVMR
jgi:fibro-slime domain-containing protein